MLADELDHYKEKGNKYVDNNIQKIQELYIDKETKKKEGKVEDEEVILIRPYEVATTTSLSLISFIMNEVKNLLKYMKFVWSPTQTRLFKPPPYYQFLKSRGKQDSMFWKEVTMAFMDQKHNMKMARNGYQIPMFQEGPLYEPYFIVIDNSVRHGSHRGGSLQNGLGDERTCGTTLASAYVLRHLSAA